MPNFLVLTNPVVKIGASPSPVDDWSSYISSVSLSTSYELHETTQVGQFFRQYVPGVAVNEVTFEFIQDFGGPSGPAGGLEQFFNNADPALSLIGTVGYCTITPTSAAVSADNPRYSFRPVISEWQPLNASVGALSTINVTWTISGDIVKSIIP